VLDINGAPINPATVTLSQTAPDGTITSISPTNSATGIYYADIVLDAPGRWTFEYVTATPATAEAVYIYAVYP
jgi:hypothetical protein